MINEQRLVLYLTKDMHKDLKAYCEELGISMNGLIKVLIDKHLKGTEGGTDR